MSLPFEDRENMLKQRCEDHWRHDWERIQNEIRTNSVHLASHLATSTALALDCYLRHRHWSPRSPPRRPIRHHFHHLQVVLKSFEVLSDGCKCTAFGGVDMSHLVQPAFLVATRKMRPLRSSTALQHIAPGHNMAPLQCAEGRGRTEDMPKCLMRRIKERKKERKKEKTSN